MRTGPSAISSNPTAVPRMKGSKMSGFFASNGAKSWIQYNFLLRPLRVHALLFIFFIAYGFIWSSPAEIGRGLSTILISPNILVTDYIAIAGLGATFVNSGIMGLIAVFVITAVRRRPFGLDMGVLGLVTGFAFFGKNPLNMLPILIGAYLFSRFSKRPFEENIVPALLGNALAPAVSQLAHIDLIPTPVGIGLGILVGVFIGFTISPLAAWFRRAHEGLNLYNVGFTAGIFAIALMALYSNLGISFEPRNYWSSGYDFQLILFLLIVSAYFIIMGFAADTGERIPLRDLFRVKTEDFDYYKQFREKIYIPMGVLGLFCFLFMLAVRAEYNGLAIGAILSIIGFGAFGKSIRHAAPIMLGAFIADIANWISFGIELNTNGSIVAILFSTCLSPLTKVHGWKWGIIAGYLHLSLATNIGIFHGGMNLYNNGLAAGLVAMLLLPIMRAFEERKARKQAEISQE